ncbi:MAG: spore germination protein [Christensenellaceae bacterium]|jgi:spore germination protein KA|nr:spore germination protein [Christensenellaceae bacterium]
MSIKADNDNYLNRVYNEIKDVIGASFDIAIEYFDLQDGRALLVYVDGLVDRDLMNRDVIGPLKSPAFKGDLKLTTRCAHSLANSQQEFITEILEGNLGIFYDRQYFLFDLRKWEKRAIQSPDAENVTRGPKEGFTEDIITCTVLLRRKLKSVDFIIENMKIGKQTNTTVAVGYIKGIADPHIIDNVKYKLGCIDVDGIVESGKLEQYLESNSLASVSGIGVTQKPDIAVKRLLEGRIIILCDGTPHVLTIPELFLDNFKTAEDYYHRVFFGSFMRVMRILGFVISVSLPGVAVAVTNYNREMLPVSYIETIIKSVSNTPFPRAVEMLFLMIMMELLKESGTRLPKTIGSAVSIVGALIVGDAAVRAGIVSSPSVMIVALTAVSGFVIPNLNEFTTIYRLSFLALGATLGIVGIGVAIVFMIAQLASIDSFGVPILSFYRTSELKDSIIRFPLKKLTLRPQNIARGNIRSASSSGLDK